MKPLPGDDERTAFLELCSELEEHFAAMRNHAMKPGNTWLAKAELAKLIQLATELDQLLDEIKRQDTQSNK